MCAQLSNEIICQCVKEINLDRIFFGQINTAITNLNDCIECCEAYKDLYDRVCRLSVFHTLHSHNPHTVHSNSLVGRPARSRCFCGRRLCAYRYCRIEYNAVQYEYKRNVCDCITDCMCPPVHSSCRFRCRKCTTSSRRRAGHSIRVASLRKSMHLFSAAKTCSRFSPLPL